MDVAAQNTNNMTIRLAPDPETVDPDTIDMYYETVNLELNRNRLKQSQHSMLVNRRKKAKTPAVLAIWDGKIQKDKKKSRGAKAKEYVCHHYKEVGHWRRNCPSYQAELKKRKNASVSSTLGIFTIELYAFPNKTWAYDTGCGTHISHVLNMVPTKKVERTSYEIWHGKAPKLSYLRVWGCEALVKQDTPKKLDPRSIKCIFVRYPKETIGYYFYYPLENKIFVARNAEFFENSLTVQEASGSHGLLESSRSDGGLELIQEEDTQPSGNTSEAALSNPEFDKWLEAMNIKMQSIKDNQVWVLVDLPPNCQTVGSKWLFKKKTDMDGNEKQHTSLESRSSKRLIALSQSAYLEKIPNKFWMENSKKGKILVRFTDVGNKMHKAFPLPVMEFPLPVKKVPTARRKEKPLL
nr:hypothetical protein [Tanacetum cinerariifolium]